MQIKQFRHHKGEYEHRSEQRPWDFGAVWLGKRREGAIVGKYRRAGAWGLVRTFQAGHFIATAVPGWSLEKLEEDDKSWLDVLLVSFFTQSNNLATLESLSINFL